MSDGLSLRVAFVTGSLRRGGAEKQLWYQATALRQRGAGVRVFAPVLGGEPYEAALRESGIPLEAFGRRPSPLVRTIRLVGAVRAFRPHVVQATHAFVNLYAAVSARATRAVGLGALRGSLRRCVEANGRWTPWLMREPSAVVVNSESGRTELLESGLLPPGRIHLLENAIDLAEYPARSGPAPLPGRMTVLFAGTLARVKRVDVLLEALAAVRARCPGVTALIAGTGPEESSLRELAGRRGLLDGGVSFLGPRDDVPALLGDADVLVLCSDDEGTPNVVMEAMASGIPVVTTPAGDAPRLVEEGVTGHVVGFGDSAAIAERLAALAASPDARRRFGEAGRARMRRRGVERVADELLAIYRAVATRESRPELLAAAEAVS